MRNFLIPIPAILLLAGSAFAQSLVGVQWDTGDLYIVDHQTGATSYLSSTGLSDPSAMETAPDGTMYLFTASSSGALYTVDAPTGNTTLIGSLNLGSVFEGGLAFSPNGIAYGTNQNHAGDPYLFSLDLNTGQGTLIGSMGSNHDINGLSWRSDGMLIGLDRVSKSLVTIDPGTGSLTILAPITPRVGGLGSMAVMSGVYYYTTAGPSGPSSGSNEIWSFDPFTGAQILIGNLGLSGKGISGLATLENSFQLTTLGSPGATMTFDVGGGTPNGPLAFLYSMGTGSHAGRNPFTGNIVTTGLSSTDFTMAALVTATSSGTSHFHVFVPAAAAGIYFVQVLDATTDKLSNVVGL